MELCSFQPMPCPCSVKADQAAQKHTKRRFVKIPSGLKGRTCPSTALVSKITRIYHHFVQRQSVKYLQSTKSYGSRKYLTRGWISLSQYKVVVDYFSPTTFFLSIRKPLFSIITTSKCLLVRNQCQLGLILTLRHCVIYTVRRCSIKWSCLYRGR